MFTTRNLKYSSLCELMNLLNETKNERMELALNDKSKEELIEILNATEIVEDQLRMEIAEKIQAESDETERFKYIAEVEPATVTFDGNSFRIFTMLTFSRPLSRKYRIADYIHSAFEKYKHKSEVKIRYQIQSPVSVFVVRHVHRFNQLLRDNDNTEDSAAINEIFAYLCMSDNPSNMRTYTRAVKIVPEDEPQGVELIICPLHLSDQMMKEVAFDD